MRKFSDWQDFENYLNGLGLFRMEAGLERIGAVLAAMSLKRPPFVVAQGVGTNGKGSACAFVASLARSHGLRCGLHCSPHFVSVRERIRFFKPRPASSQAPEARGGEMFSEAEWLDGVNRVMAHGGEKLTYFELITVLAVQLFKTAGVELAIMESGLGGNFDATTALAAELVFFTPIDLDHAEILGPTLAEIAKDKAGAIRCGAPVISAAQRAEARRELEAAALAKGAPLFFTQGTRILPEGLRLKARAFPVLSAPEKTEDDRHRHEPPAPKAEIQLSLPGKHQLDNAALGLQVWRALRDFLPDNGFKRFSPECANAAELRGLTGAWLPGRLQMVESYGLKEYLPGKGKLVPPAHPPLILDGAHNPHGISALGHSLALLGIAPPVTIFSCLRGKQPENMIPHLRVLSAGLIIVPQIREHPNAMNAGELAALIGRPAVAVKDIREALEMGTASLLERLPEAAEQSIQECKYPLLICGSLYLLGEFYRLYPQYLN